MKKNEHPYRIFARNLASKGPKQIYLFYGPEVHLFIDALKRLRTKILGEDVNSLNYMVYEGDISSMKDIANAIQTFPLFTSNRMVVVKGIEQLVSEDLSELAGILEDMPALSYVVLQSNNEKVDGRLKLVKLCQTEGSVVNLRRLFSEELETFIGNKVKDLGLRMDKNALKAFISIVDNDLWNVGNELEKLATYQGRNGEVLTEQDVRIVVASAIEEDIFEVINAIAQKDKEKALALSFQMLRGKTPVPLMLALIIRQLTLLYKIKLMLEQSFSITTQEMAHDLGIPTYVVGKCLKQQKWFALDELEKALNHLARVEKVVKTGEGDGVLALEVAILSIVTQQGNQFH
jgi:DNA polymerase-3 subunit delta